MPLLEENDERAYERDGDFDFAGLLVLDLKNEILFRLSFYPSVPEEEERNRFNATHLSLDLESSLSRLEDFRAEK